MYASSETDLEVLEHSKIGPMRKCDDDELISYLEKSVIPEFEELRQIRRLVREMSTALL